MTIAPIAPAVGDERREDLTTWAYRTMCRYSCWIRHDGAERVAADLGGATVEELRALVCMSAAMIPADPADEPEGGLLGWWRERPDVALDDLSYTALLADAEGRAER